MKLKNESIETVKQMLSSGDGIENVLMYLRVQKLSKVESIKLLTDLGVASFGESKRIVHNSKVWRDVYARDNEFHDCLEEMDFDSPIND